jgi:DMSO/TMAO reductase YedYZ molybdopterin-dependent catalytic subunit
MGALQRFDGGQSRSGEAMTRRRLIGRLAAAGFSTPVIASILAEGSWAQSTPEAGTPEAGTPMAGTPVAATPVVADESTPTAEEILTSLGKDTRLIQHGSTTFETPLELIDGLYTPNELFFIRSNGPVSIDIDPDEWRLRVTGLVDQELELSMSDLEGMSPRTLSAFIECSGNSRSRFAEDHEAASGTQWGNGAIGNAEWTGISLATVLNEAGVQDGVVDVVSQGGDFEDMQRGLPLEIALDPDVMLVWEMNGEPIPNPNGGPVRLLVPGWGGIASTKWIVGLELIDHPFQGHFNVESYVIRDEDDAVLRPVQNMPVKSVITSPTPNSQVSAGSQTIAGYAWSGYAEVEMVEVSTDGGENWTEAEIVAEAGPYSWMRFEVEWDAQAGDAVLMSRAQDGRGLTQPVSLPWNQQGYQMNEIYAVPVTVS